MSGRNVNTSDRTKDVELRGRLDKKQQKQLDHVLEFKSDWEDKEAYDFCVKCHFDDKSITRGIQNLFHDDHRMYSGWQVKEKKGKKKDKHSSPSSKENQSRSRNQTRSANRRGGVAGNRNQNISVGRARRQQRYPRNQSDRSSKFSHSNGPRDHINRSAGRGRGRGQPNAPIHQAAGRTVLQSASARPPNSPSTGVQAVSTPPQTQVQQSALATATQPQTRPPQQSTPGTTGTTGHVNPALEYPKYGGGGSRHSQERTARQAPSSSPQGGQKSNNWANLLKQSTHSTPAPTTVTQSPTTPAPPPNHHKPSPSPVTPPIQSFKPPTQPTQPNPSIRGGSNPVSRRTMPDQQMRSRNFRPPEQKPTAQKPPQTPVQPPSVPTRGDVTPHSGTNSSETPDFSTQRQAPTPVRQPAPTANRQQPNPDISQTTQTTTQTRPILQSTGSISSTVLAKPLSIPGTRPGASSLVPQNTSQQQQKPLRSSTQAQVRQQPPSAQTVAARNRVTQQQQPVVRAQPKPSMKDSKVLPKPIGSRQAMHPKPSYSNFVGTGMGKQRWVVKKAPAPNASTSISSVQKRTQQTASSQPLYTSATASAQKSTYQPRAAQTSNVSSVDISTPPVHFPKAYGSTLGDDSSKPHMFGTFGNSTRSGVEIPALSTSDMRPEKQQTDTTADLFKKPPSTASLSQDSSQQSQQQPSQSEPASQNSSRPPSRQHSQPEPQQQPLTAPKQPLTQPPAATKPPVPTQSVPSQGVTVPSGTTATSVLSQSTNTVTVPPQTQTMVPPTRVAPPTTAVPKPQPTEDQKPTENKSVDQQSQPTHVPSQPLYQQQIQHPTYHKPALDSQYQPATVPNTSDPTIYSRMQMGPQMSAYPQSVPQGQTVQTTMQQSKTQGVSSHSFHQNAAYSMPPHAAYNLPYHHYVADGQDHSGIAPQPTGTFQNPSYYPYPTYRQVQPTQKYQTATGTTQPTAPSHGASGVDATSSGGTVASATDGTQLQSTSAPQTASQSSSSTSDRKFQTASTSTSTSGVSTSISSSQSTSMESATKTPGGSVSGVSAMHQGHGGTTQYSPSAATRQQIYSNPMYGPAAAQQMPTFYPAPYYQQTSTSFPPGYGHSGGRFYQTGGGHAYANLHTTQQTFGSPTSPTIQQISASQSGGYDEDTTAQSTEYYTHGTTASQAIGHSGTSGHGQPGTQRVGAPSSTGHAPRPSNGVGGAAMGDQIDSSSSWSYGQQPDSSKVDPTSAQSTSQSAFDSLHPHPQVAAQTQYEQQNGDYRQQAQAVSGYAMPSAAGTATHFGGVHQGFGSGLVYSQPHQQQAQHPQHPNAMYNQSTWTA